MPDNPFPSLLIGHDEDDGEDEALLQLTAQEEAMLPGVLPGDELELLEPPSHSRPTEEDTLINPGDWSTHSPRRGGCDRASSEVLHSKKVMEGGAPSLGGKDLAAALPRQTVAAIQKRRALAQAQGRGWWKDRVWFFWLSLSFLCKLSKASFLLECVHDEMTADLIPEIFADGASAHLFTPSHSATWSI